MATDQKTPERVRFADFEFDHRSGDLRRAGSPVKLPPQPAKILSMLIQRPGEVVTRQELAESIWGVGTFVDFEQGLNHAIRQIRSVLQDDAEQPRFLETVPKRGYRFLASVSGEFPSPGEPPTSAIPVSSARQRLPGRIGLVLVAALVLGIFMFLAWRGGLFDKKWFGSGSTGRIGSVAVLPLQNLSTDPNQEYFSDGMTDELITALAKSKGLHVISHTSVERYKGTKLSLPDIAKELGVDAIVEGTVMRSGDRVRITAQLIDARSDQHVWAESYEGDFGDVLGLQDQVARQVASEVGSSLTSFEPVSTPRKVDPAAHEAYLQGAFFFDQTKCSSFAKALTSFQESAAKDPSFAPAYSGIAESNFELADWRCSQGGTLDDAKAAALKALAVDPSSARAHAVLGEIAFFHDWQWTKAAGEFGKAIQLDPSDAGIQSTYGTYLVALGNAEQGLAEIRKALQIDPVSEKTNQAYIKALFLAHHFDEAIAQAKHALNFSNSSGEYYWLGECYEKKGMPDQAISSYLQVWSGLPDQIPRRRAAYQKHGLPGYWREDEQLRKRLNLKIDAFLQAMYYAHTGENEKALAQLKLAYQQHCDGLQFLKVDPHFDGLRGEPGFRELLAKLGL